MKKKVGKVLFWLPRILSILLIANLALMSLDVFEPSLKWWEIMLALFMHNIPVLVLIALLVVAWKHEMVGAITFGTSGLLYILLTFTRVPWQLALLWSLILAGPALLIAILFIFNWHIKRKK